MTTIHPSQRRTLSSRHKKVDELVRTYDGFKEPSAPLRDILRQPERASLLVYALGRQILLIKSRSVAFDDGQITLYDRALLVLSLDGKDLANIGALELFATEYLGGPALSQDFVFESKDIDVQYALEKAARYQKKEVVYNTAASTGTIGNQEEPFMTNFFHKHQEDQAKNLSSATSQEDQAADQSHKSTIDNEVNERLNRMLAIFYRAKEDYNRVRNCENGHLCDAIRFLRDTTENTIIYLRSNGLSNHTSMAELEETFRYSKEKAVDLSGGRKRPFDDEYPENAVNALPVDRKRHGPKRRRVPRRAMIDSYRPT